MSSSDGENAFKDFIFQNVKGQKLVSLSHIRCNKKINLKTFSEVGHPLWLNLQKNVTPKSTEKRQVKPLTLGFYISLVAAKWLPHQDQEKHIKIYRFSA